MTKSDRTAGYQRWSELLFVHWKVPAAQLQPLLPDELTVETFDGNAWIGFVPFSMERIRPWWFVPTPGVSWFLETNIRTYVRHANGTTGVWFFSLDANHRLAVWIANRFWHLPYFYSELSITTDGQRKQYQGKRLDGSGDYCVDVTLDREELLTAEPGSLDHFLLERYTLFAATPKSGLRQGRVHHVPYQFQSVQCDSIQQRLTEVHGISLTTHPDHVVFSPGVDVRVSPLEVV